MILLIFLFSAMATGFTFSKAALDYASPIFIVGIRMTLSGCLLLGYYFLIKKEKVNFSIKNIGLWLQIIFFHIYSTYCLENWALQEVSSSKSCLIYNLLPFFTAIFSWFMLKERLTMKQFFSLIIGFLGFIPILLTENGAVNAAKNSHTALFSVYEIAIILSVAAAAYGWMVMRKLTINEGNSPIFINGIAMFFGGILSFLTSFILDGWPKITLKGHISWGDAFLANIFGSHGAAVVMLLFYVFLLILFTNIIGYNLYGILLKKYSPTFLSFAGLSTPLFAAFFGWVWLGETITWHFIATLCIVSFGLYLFYQDELKWGKIVK